MPLLRYGSTGPDVAEVQRLLTAAGHILPDDGRFDHRVVAAVREYQSEHGLSADGIVGPLTLASLRGAELLIADVSQFGGVPSRAALRARGCRGVIVRASSGLDVDTLAPQQVAEAGEDALGAYHYLRSWRDGAAQAEHAWTVAAGLGLPWSALDLEPVLSGTRATDAPHVARLVAHAFAVRYREVSGKRPILYGPSYYLSECNLDPDLFGALWAAHVGKNGTPRMGAPMAVKNFAAPALHQFQHNVRIGGGVVDWNRASGTMETLRAALAASP